MENIKFFEKLILFVIFSMTLFNFSSSTHAKPSSNTSALHVVESLKHDVEHIHNLPEFELEKTIDKHSKNYFKLMPNLFPSFAFKYEIGGGYVENLLASKDSNQYPYQLVFNKESLYLIYAYLRADFKGSGRTVYEQLFKHEIVKNNIKLLYKINYKLENNDWYFKEILKRTKHSILTDNRTMITYGAHTNFLDNDFIPNLKEIRKIDKNYIGKVLTIPKNDSKEVKKLLGFLLRREYDGSREAIINIITLILDELDPDFISNAISEIKNVPLLEQKDKNELKTWILKTIEKKNEMAKKTTEELDFIPVEYMDSYDADMYKFRGYYVGKLGYILDYTKRKGEQIEKEKYFILTDRGLIETKANIIFDRQQSIDKNDVEVKLLFKGIKRKEKIYLIFKSNPENIKLEYSSFKEIKREPSKLPGPPDHYNIHYSSEDGVWQYKTEMEYSELLYNGKIIKSIKGDDEGRNQYSFEIRSVFTIDQKRYIILYENDPKYYMYKENIYLIDKNNELKEVEPLKPIIEITPYIGC